MRKALPRLIISVAAAAPAAVALTVTPGSPCSTSCGNTLSSTSPDEMVCSEEAYKGSSAGTVFQNCVTCETSSTYSSGEETDLQHLLYNLRFNLGYCLWGAPMGNTEIENNPCITSTACLPFKDAIEYGNYSSTVGSFDYCDDWEGNRVAACNSCLSSLKNGHYLRNYVTMLDAACTQRPGNGSTISIKGSPFETTAVVITTPIPTYASLPLPDYGPVSLGARVGIAFGVLALILAITGFCIVFNGKRRRRAFLRKLERRQGHGWPPHLNPRQGPHGDMLETPASQKPLTGWNGSPVSAYNESPISMPRNFSPYNSQHNSPVSVSDGPTAAGINWPALTPQRLNHLIQEQSPVPGSPPPAFTQWPSATQEKLLLQLHHEQRQNEIAIGLALGSDDASLRSKTSNQSMNNNPYTNGMYAAADRKGKKRDEYEMQEVESPYSGGSCPPVGYRMPAEPDPPVLHHPGYGRHHVAR